jgi:hypothetical protein
MGAGQGDWRASAGCGAITKLPVGIVAPGVGWGGWGGGGGGVGVGWGVGGGVGGWVGGVGGGVGGGGHAWKEFSDEVRANVC